MKALKQFGLIAFVAMAMLSCSSLTDLTAGLNTGDPGVEKGAFSVSPNTKVFFAKGNLQYQASTVTWRFAEYQWDYIGERNEKISEANEDWIDLFGWGTGYNPCKNDDDAVSYSSFNDWGKNTIINGDDKTWFTLSQEEWTYLLESRKTKSGILYAKAIVNNVNGLILLPDSWSAFTYVLTDYNKDDASFSTNRISQKVWNEKFDANGAIFLPAAGWRNGEGTRAVGTGGLYWSATSSGAAMSQSIYFNDGSFYTANRDGKQFGFSVRLVTVVE